MFRTWRSDLDNQIRRAPDPVPGNLQSVTRYENDVRLYYQISLPIEHDRKRRNTDLSECVVAHVRIENDGQTKHFSLVAVSGRRRLTHDAKDQLLWPIRLGHFEELVGGDSLLHDDDDGIVAKRKARKTLCQEKVVPAGYTAVVPLQIGSQTLSSPFVIAPMAGMTDTAFRRLVKRQGGCGLVVTEMVSSEGLVRGIDRTLEYAEYTEEERPVSIQIFGGDPEKMADAAQIVEALGANIVDVNMGCPVPKIAKHSAGCSLMRDPHHAASVIAAMAKRVNIPVTVKMRAGWNEDSINAPDLAKRVEDAGAAAVAVHGRTAAQSYTGHSDWELIDRVAESVTIPVLGSGDCIEPQQIIERMGGSSVSGVLVGRGVLRNPWILAQAADLAAGRRAREITFEDRGRFLLDYLELLLNEGENEAEGFRHRAGQIESRIPDPQSPRNSHHRWVINKMRALVSWYSKGLDNGSHLRMAINSSDSISQTRDIIAQFFALEESAVPAAARG